MAIDVTHTDPRFFLQRRLTVPNVLSALRLVAAPVFGILWGLEMTAAAYVFAIAALTDAIDGFLARRLRCQTLFGAMLDPIADKTLIIISVLIGFSVGRIPAWFVAVVIGRDALIGIGAMFFGFIKPGILNATEWTPTRTSKAAMLLTSAALLAVILCDVFRVRALTPMLMPLMLAASVPTVISCGQYVLRAHKAWTRRPR